jgi:hypothetical protein
MIKTKIKADGRYITIQLPENYIGKEIEIIAFDIDEVTVVQNIIDRTLTYFASEKVLAEDWLTAEEDKAWQDL